METWSRLLDVACWIVVTSLVLLLGKRLVRCLIRAYQEAYDSYKIGKAQSIELCAQLLMVCSPIEDFFIL